MEWLNPEYISEKVIDYAPSVIGSIFTLIIGFWLAGRVVRVVKKGMDKSGIDASLKPFVGSLIGIGLKVLVLISAAGMFGIEVTSFIAILSAVAFAIGLALQGTLGHLASGVLILIFKPFTVGHFVITQGYSGTVKEIQLFNTILTTLDNRIIIIPNGAITSGPLENLTVNGTRKMDLLFGIGYGDDIDKARKVILSVVESEERIMHDQGVEVFVKELGGSSVNLATRFWVTAENYWPVFFYMQENIKKAFDREGVSIPFPQMDVHMKSK
jgi:small conductance mechanosensitive channel